jgi:hypothetical protein
MTKLPAADQTLDSPARISGKAVVLGMIGFACLMVAGLWIYWEFYTRPYRELQIAIAQEFAKSSPRVIGGRYKSGRGGAPWTLRVLVYVPLGRFNPEEESPERTETLLRLAQLAGEHHDLSKYEVLEIRLMQKLPEQQWRRFDVSRPVTAWQAELAGVELQAAGTQH